MLKTLSTRWSWLDDGVMPILLTLLRTCWLWPWLGFVQYLLAPSEPAAALPIWILVALPFFGFTLARQLTKPSSTEQIQERIPQLAAISWQARLLLALVGIGAIVFVLWWQLMRMDYRFLDFQWPLLLAERFIHWPPDGISAAVLIALAGVFLWLRSLLDVQSAMSHDQVWATIATGFSALAIYLMLTAAAGYGSTADSAGLIISFLILAMVALAFSSLKVTVGLDRALSFRSRRGTASPTINRYWLLSVFLVIVLLVGGGLLLAALISPDTLAALLNWARTIVTFVGQIILTAMVYVGYLLLLAAVYIARLLWPLIQRFLPEEVEEQPFQLPQAPEPFATQIPTTEEVLVVSDTYRYIGLGATICVVILVFVLVLRRWRLRATEELEEERESILSGELLQSQLGNLWQRLSERFNPAAALAPFLSLDGEPSARRQIRQIYQQLLMAASRSGTMRQRHATPGEFSPNLIRLLEREADSAPDTAMSNAMETITQKYMIARYAEDEPSATDLEAAQEAWKTIEEVLNRSELMQKGLKP